MAHINKMTDKPRTLPWRAQVRSKGHPTLVKMFKTKAEAEHWAAEYERSIRMTGLPLTIQDLKKHTVSEIVTRYRDEITPTKGCHVSETTVLNKFLRRKEFCSKSLAYITKQDAYKYVDDRLKETWRGKPITPRTVRREINSIQHVFEVAKERWGMENLVNPFRGLPIKGSMHHRRRRLEHGELEKLEDACQRCRGLNRYYVPLAIHLAIDTGMRLQEVFALAWEDIDLENRRIEVRKSKTDYLTGENGRTIVLPIMVLMYLLLLRFSLLSEGMLPGPDRIIATDISTKGPIFPMSQGAFQQSWADVRRRAGIRGLRLHDLRREAGSRFHEAGLSTPEQKLMMGHPVRDTTSIYIRVDPKLVQDKLDRYILKGKTLDELSERIDRDVPEEQLVGFRALHRAITEGLTREEALAWQASEVAAWKARSNKAKSLGSQTTAQS